MALSPGQILNERYRIEGPLGQGGMGAVYDAWDIRLRVRVALKENLNLSDSSQRQFHREARLLATLRHPNLPRVTDHFLLPGQGQYLVMDFVEGQDVAQRIARFGRLREDEVLRWADELLGALAYLHDRSVIHRDIKPANIRVTPEGHAILVDFGIAKDIATGGVTMTGARGLTPGYASPEQYGVGATDARSDLYSFGATLYAMLTGDAPADALSRLTRPEKFVPLVRHAARISPSVAAAIDRALEMNPEVRFQGAESMRSALKAGGAKTVVEPLPPAIRGVPPPKAGPAPVEGPRRSRSGLWLGLAALGVVVSLLCLGGGGVAMLALLGGRSGPEPTATVPRAGPTATRGVLLEDATVEARRDATATARAEETATESAAATEVAAATEAAAQQTATAVALAELQAATATAQAVQARVDPAFNWPVFLSETFDSNANRWATGLIDDEYAAVNRRVEAGLYRWEATAKRDFISYATPGMDSLADFFAVVDAHQASGAEDGEYGIVFRYVDNQNYYLFGVADNGYFRVDAFAGGSWTTFIDWTETPLVRSKEVNRLAVVAQGTHFDLFINGEHVGEVEDSTLTSGDVGVVIGLFTPEDAGTFQFDNFEVRRP